MHQRFSAHAAFVRYDMHGVGGAYTERDHVHVLRLALVVVSMRSRPHGDGTRLLTFRQECPLKTLEVVGTSMVPLCTSLPR